MGKTEQNRALEIALNALDTIAKGNWNSGAPMRMAAREYAKRAREAARDEALLSMEEGEQGLRSSSSDIARVAGATSPSAPSTFTGERAAIHAWIRDDVPWAGKMNLTPHHIDALVAKLEAARSVAHSSDGGDA